MDEPEKNVSLKTREVHRFVKPCGAVLSIYASQSTMEAPMRSILKLVGVISYGFVLCLVLSNATQAGEALKPDPCADRKGSLPNLTECDQEIRQGIDTIKGEVLRVEADDYLIQRFDGREVRLHTDAYTQTTGMISRGDRIEAKVQEVDDQKHVLSISKTK